MEMSKRKKSNRKIHTRDLIERILIVCEGEKTEPNYFRKFLIDENKCYVKTTGEGYNTVRLVQKAIKVQKESMPPYNKVWCVFDRDSFPAKDFNKAIKEAKKKGIEVAYSNEAFELWYFLHFDYCDSAMSRDQYQEKLSDLLGHKYEKNCETMYQELLYIQLMAIRNAERLLNSYDSFNPENNNPSTTVHKLVEELNKRLLRHK